MQNAKQVALVTGGASGIGAATSRMLAATGVHVILASEASVESMWPFEEELRDQGGSCEAVTCDVTDRRSVGGLIDLISVRHGRLDILVNSAGVFHTTPAFTSNPDTVEQLFRVNSLGAINLIYRVLPLMRAAGSGNIVSIASSAAVLGGATFAAYSASKAALVHFTRTLAAELGRSSIRINCVAPGSVRTGMTAFSHTPQTEEMRKVLAARIANTTSPFGTPYSAPEDIAHIVMFLLSNESVAIQGACIVADQGTSAAATPLAH